ncbi:unnamed protein product [Heligmosomoides polygyrus]|uniref:Kinesin motor domain-containing protein n=1 Tax=Heligmosomoides polygyrus TaxID=6339 RepID=A0A183G6S9_HELPZ|nr:unnamed protein product [Heligmosomoides polygyrus]
MQEVPARPPRSENQEEPMQSPSQFRNPSPVPGPSGAFVKVAAPARKAVQEGDSLAPKPPAKRPCDGENYRQPPAKAGRERTPSSFRYATIRHFDATRKSVAEAVARINIRMCLLFESEPLHV